MLTWINEEPQLLGQETQPVTPATFPITGAKPKDWPAGVDYPPPRPTWWPAGLTYPPIGDSWATTAPQWWTAGQQAGTLPNWPPPKPDGWPASYPYPVPPTSVSPLVPCADVCVARFGPAGTTPDAQALSGCKLACSIAASALPPGGGGPTFKLPPQVTTQPAPAPKKTSSTGPILISLGLLALVGVVALGGARAQLD
jgi:hypothetical protein